MMMIEKAARALKAKLGEALDAKPLLGDATSGDWWADGGSIDCIELVRAVLTAIREPDEAMGDAMCKIVYGKPTFDWHSADFMARIWQASIDAILQEKP